MKLQNKKTGGLATLVENEDCLTLKTDAGFHHYFSLAQLNKEWEDYEEPKEYWCIDCFSPDGLISEFTGSSSDILENRKSIGNYFNTREEAEKAVEKLKAWHKLMDYWETEVLGWEIRDMPTGGNWQTVNVKFNVKTRKEPVELLDLLFGGEE